MPSLATLPSRKEGSDMRELSPGAAALVRAGRSAFRPEASDRERLLQSLTRTLGENALHGAESAELAKGAATTRFPLWGKVLGGLGALAVGAGLVVAPRAWPRTPSTSGPAPVTSSIIPAPQPEPLPPTTQTDGDRTPVQLADQGVPDTPDRACERRTRGHRRIRLAEEVRLLSKAEQQLYAGHAADVCSEDSANTNGDFRTARSRNSAWQRERSRCARSAGWREARADLTKLARAYPGSPQLITLEASAVSTRFELPRLVPAWRRCGASEVKATVISLTDVAGTRHCVVRHGRTQPRYSSKSFRAFRWLATLAPLARFGMACGGTGAAGGPDGSFDAAGS